MLHGTRPESKRALAAAPAVDPNPVPDAPVLLDEVGKEHWRQLAPQLAALGRLPAHAHGTFFLLCDQWSLYVRARTSRPKRFTGKAFPPSVAIAERARAAYAQLALRFGLDPASDARLAEVGGGGAAASPAAGAAPGVTPDESWHREFGA